jgi:hypothetical protein
MSTATFFDFDRIELWAPELRTLVADLVPNDLEAVIAAAAPKYIEDALDVLFRVADRNGVTDRVSAWIKSRPVAAYHGSRLTDDEIATMRREGLRPLVASERKERLRRVLGAHPRWSEVEPRLDEALRLYGPGNHGGRREGQVHLTVSRAGLMRGFSQYLAQGSEFDWHVAHHLLGFEGQALLARHGRPVLVECRVPGEEAFAACNRHGVISSLLPNLVADVLQVWSYRLAHTDYSSERRKLDCGMVFAAHLPASWIVAAGVIEVEARKAQ